MDLVLLLSAVFRFCSKTVEMGIGFWVPVLLLFISEYLPSNGSDA